MSSDADWTNCGVAGEGAYGGGTRNFPRNRKEALRDRTSAARDYVNSPPSSTTPMTHSDRGARNRAIDAHTAAEAHND